MTIADINEQPRRPEPIIRPFVKLDNVDKAAEIHRRTRLGQTVMQIAADVGVTPGAISSVARSEGISVIGSQQTRWPKKGEPGVLVGNRYDPWDGAPTDLAQRLWARATKTARSMRRKAARVPQAASTAKPDIIAVYYGVPVNLLSPPSARNIAHLVALRHLVSLDDVLGFRRDRRMVAIRTEAIKLVRQHCPHLSLKMIGRIFGNRDHTTILFSLQKGGGDK